MTNFSPPQTVTGNLVDALQMSSFCTAIKQFLTKMNTVARALVRRSVQMLTFLTYVVWYAVIKITGVVLVMLFGEDYKLSMYGNTLRKTKFSFDADVALTNHGSYGAVPCPVQDAQRQFQDATTQCPDRWFRYELRPLWNRALKIAARFVGSKPENLVFVPNATAGINTVLRSLDITESSQVLTTNQTYGAVHLAVQEVCQAKKAKQLVLNVNFPASDYNGRADVFVQDIVEQYEQVLKENRAVKVAVIDYITSSSALLLPVKELVQVCHSHGVTIVIDGAHAPGQVELNLEELGADFFIGNLHKWSFAPHGCAILWVKPKFHDIVDPLLVSWLHDQGLQDRFFQQGTLDYTSYTSVPAAIQFYQEIGGLSGISKYNCQLISWAATMLAELWGTEVLPVPESMRAPFMVTIRLPKAFNIVYTSNKNGADQLIQDLYEMYRVITIVVCIQSTLWCRVSAQVYNVQEDYLCLGEAVLQMQDKIVNGTHPSLLSADLKRWSSSIFCK